MTNIADDYNEEELFTKSSPPAPGTVKSNGNPLSSYYRVPGLHIKLPTRGKFFSKGNYSETLSGDIPIYPMRASDEMLLKTPDALMNGYALEQLILSCAPAIIEPREVSTPDLDVILLAIRAATFGHIMELEVDCPNCSHTNSFDCDLAALMSTMSYVDPENEIRINDEVIVYVRPYNLASAIKITLATYEETQKIRNLEYQENITPEERTKLLNDTYALLGNLNNEAIVDSIISVIIPSGPVTKKEYIADFIVNIDRNSFKKIEKTLADINAKGIDKKIEAQCSECNHTWTTQIEFDPTNFFGISS